MSTRTAAWLAWDVCAISLAFTALCFLLIALNLSLNTPAYFFWPDLTSIAVGYSVIGAIIASRLPKHPIGWICCAIGLIAAVNHFAGEYAVFALLAQPHPLPGDALAPGLGLDAVRRPHCVPAPTVSHWSAAQQSLATFRMGECGRNFSGGGFVVGHLSRCGVQRTPLPRSAVFSL